MSATPGAPLPYERPVGPDGRSLRDNPFTLALVVIGALLAVGGLILVLLPVGSGDELPAARLVLGGIMLSTAGTVLTAAVVLAGFGWVVREQTRVLARG